MQQLDREVLAHLDSNDARSQHGSRAARAVTLLQEAISLLASDEREAVQLPTPSIRHDRLIRLPEVQKMTGLRRSAIYEQMQRGTFPRSVKIGPRAATWSEAAVQAWIAKCLQTRV